MPLNLTWRNDRFGLDGIAKQLDQFLIHENLVEQRGLFHSWVVVVRLYNHDAIILHWCSDREWMGLPFKFNHMWL